MAGWCSKAGAGRHRETCKSALAISAVVGPCMQLAFIVKEGLRALVCCPPVSPSCIAPTANNARFPPLCKLTERRNPLVLPQLST
jgi:hypothetical protein